jgi:hypothetical protein
MAAEGLGQQQWLESDSLLVAAGCCAAVQVALLPVPQHHPA